MDTAADSTDLINWLAAQSGVPLSSPKFPEVPLLTIDKHQVLWYNIANAASQKPQEGRQARMDSEKLLTVPEVAEILQVSPSTVYRRIQAGELPAIKLGHRQVRIKQGDLDAYIEAHRIVGEPPEQAPVDEETSEREER